MSNIFIVGQVARVTCEIRDTDGLLVDPGALLIKTRIGSGQVSSIAFGAAPEIVRDSVGVFHADIPLSGKGTLYYRWEIDGALKGAAEGEVVVAAGRFP